MFFCLFINKILRLPQYGLRTTNKEEGERLEESEPIALELNWIKTKTTTNKTFVTIF